MRKFAERTAVIFALFLVWLGGMELGNPGWASFCWCLLRMAVRFILAALLLTPFAFLALAGGP